MQLINTKSAYGALFTTFSPAYERFIANLRNPNERQLRIFRETIQKNKETIFGKEHGFTDSMTLEDFRKNVPIRKYEDIMGYILMIAEGKKSVLTIDDVLLLEPTSGSSSASKLIPYTASLKRQFQEGVFPWIADLIKKKPISNGKFYWSISPASNQNTTTAGGISLGYGDDVSYFPEKIHSELNELSIVPFSLASIANMHDYRISTLTNLLQDENLSFISVWNPSFLTTFIDYLKEHQEEIIKRLPKKRRGEVKRILKDQNPNFAELWKNNLKLISCWTDANAIYSVKGLRRMFPTTEIQGKGLMATEGIVSIPIIGYENPILAFNSHFFEFRYIENNEVALTDEVKKNRRYEVIMTTAGGLYRYNIEDIVEVSDFAGKTPMLKFLGRNNSYSDFFGEKLHEAEVNAVLEKSLKKNNISPEFILVAPEITGLKPHYLVFIHTQNRIKPGLQKSIEEGLCQNYHYRYCRRLGQLGELEIVQVMKMPKKDIKNKCY